MKSRNQLVADLDGASQHRPPWKYALGSTVTTTSISEKSISVRASSTASTLMSSDTAPPKYSRSGLSSEEGGEAVASSKPAVQRHHLDVKFPVTGRLQVFLNRNKICAVERIFVVFGFLARGVICNAIWKVNEEHRYPQLTDGRYPRRARKADRKTYPGQGSGGTTLESAGRSGLLRDAGLPIVGRRHVLVRFITLDLRAAFFKTISASSVRTDNVDLRPPLSNGICE